jgi:hypothetical protein
VLGLGRGDAVEVRMRQRMVGDQKALVNTLQFRATQLPDFFGVTIFPAGAALVGIRGNI